MRIIGFNETEREKFLEMLPFYNFFTVKGSLYGQEEDVIVPGENFGMCVSASLSEDIVYRVFKAIYEHRDELDAVYSGSRGNDIIALTTGSSCWLHSGVIKYLKEIGIQPRADQIPPEYKN
jgi:TRAP-type uncharacterized transport system substrate-binding protein